MSSTMIQKFEGELITEDVLEAAAKLFSLNYGIWGPLAEENLGPFVKQGQQLFLLSRRANGRTIGARVKMSSKKLMDQILPLGADNIYIRMLIDNELVGNVFATRWVCEGSPWSGLLNFV
jgi:hypothetical protein